MHTRVRTCVYTRVRMCMYTCMCVCSCTHMCVCSHVCAPHPSCLVPWLLALCLQVRQDRRPAWDLLYLVPLPLPPSKAELPRTCPLLRVHPESEGAARHSGVASGLVPPIARGHCRLQGSSRGQEPKEAVCCTRTPSEVGKESASRSRTWDHDSTHCPPRCACRSPALIPAGRKQLTRAPPFQRRQPLTTSSQLCVRWARVLSGNDYYRRGHGG